MENHLFINAWRLIKPYWQSEEKWKALTRLIIVLLFSTALVRLQVVANDLTKSFYDAIQKFDVTLITHYILLYLLVIIVFSAVAALQGYIFGNLANYWRRWLTENFVARWLSDTAYYQMGVTKNQVDNPDQRIAEDIDSLSTVTLNLLVGLYTAIFQLCTFTILLWKIGGALTLNVAHRTWHIPGYLLWCVLTYAVFNTIVTMFIGKRLAGLNYQQQHYNADFRFSLMRLREYGEQIALFRGEKNEQARLKSTYRPIFTNYLNILSVARNLTFFMRATDLLALMVGVLFALPIFIQTHATIGSLMQMASLVGYEYDALSFIISAYTTIAVWRAVITRLTEFLQKIEIATKVLAQSKINTRIAEKVALEQVDVYLPSGEFLQKQLSWEAYPGEKILIVGPSGCGKSTILRIIAGLWPFALGSIVVPQGEKMFLSQKPYLPPITLLESICFPSLAIQFNRKEVEEYLQALDLPLLVALLDVTRNWHQELSLGEQQRIAIIRALLHHPKWLFLDEATASLDEKTENKVYALLQKVLPTTTIISIGHRKNLMSLHDRVIEMNPI